MRESPWDWGFYSYSVGFFSSSSSLGLLFLARNIPNLYCQFISKNITTFSHMQLPEDPDSDACQKLYNQQLMARHTFTKSAVTMASSVWDPGSHTALMMKFPVASWGWSTKWSETEPELLNVNTWQSWSNGENWLNIKTKCSQIFEAKNGLKNQHFSYGK